MPVKDHCAEEPVGVRLAGGTAKHSATHTAAQLRNQSTAPFAAPQGAAPPDAVPHGAAEARRGGLADTPLAELSDLELVAGVQRASEVHFNELYNRYFKRIYGFVHGRLRNHADTEEVTQETFVTIFKSIENYRGQSSLLSWMFGIAKNLSNNMIRRSQNQRDRFESVDKEHFTPNPSIGQGAPDEDLSLHRYAEAIRGRMSSLPDWQCRIFEMRHLENMSIPEIARISRRSNDAVRSSLYRVKKLIFEAVDSGGEVHAR